MGLMQTIGQPAGDKIPVTPREADGWAQVLRVAFEPAGADVRAL